MVVATSKGLVILDPFWGVVVASHVGSCSSIDIAIGRVVVVVVMNGNGRQSGLEHMAIDSRRKLIEPTLFSCPLLVITCMIA